MLAEVCDAINATDASGANCHMSQRGACCALLTRAGYEPVFQISCRDRNRIAIQGDLLGAAAMGVRNVLCLTGDDVTAGDQPQAKPVFDLDSHRTAAHGAHHARPGRLPERAASSTTPPRALPGRGRESVCAALRLAPAAPGARRSRPGQTSSRPSTASTCHGCARFMQTVRDLGLHEKAFILVGVGPLRSARSPS